MRGKSSFICKRYINNTIDCLLSLLNARLCNVFGSAVSLSSFPTVGVHLFYSCRKNAKCELIYNNNLSDKIIVYALLIYVDNSRSQTPEPVCGL